MSSPFSPLFKYLIFTRYLILVGDGHTIIGHLLDIPIIVILDPSLRDILIPHGTAGHGPAAVVITHHHLEGGSIQGIILYCYQVLSFLCTD